MIDFAINFPFNRTSLGQCSHSIARELMGKELEPCVFHIGQPEVSNAPEERLYAEWLSKCSAKADERHNRANPCVKLWHIQNSLESFSRDQYLYTFYELDQPTAREINILRNQKKVLMPSSHFTDMFATYGIDTLAVPLGFDKNSFSKVDVKYGDDRICFGLAGKLEKRKNHLKILRAWAKKYGNRRDIFLNCAIFNHFMKPEDQSALIGQALEGKKYFNINFINWMDTNAEYNQFLNASHIILAMSGGESWGLPEFTSVAIGKHCVGLHAHGYKEWMNAENSILLSPSGKTPAYDGLFFKEGHPFNQGNIYDFSESEFLDACDVAISKAKANPINTEGEKLQEKFTWEKTTNAIIAAIK